MSKPRYKNWASLRDIKLLLVIAVMSAAAAVWPRRWDLWLLNFRAALFLRLRPGKIARMAELMGQVLGPATADTDLMAQAREHYRMCQETAWLRIRHIQAAKSIEKIEIEGMQHLHAALSAGKGVILWGMLFSGYSLQKKALSQAGVQVSHLSRQDHAAPSQNWLGLHVVAPWLWRAETPFLESRVIIPLDGSLGYMRELMDLLQRNQCISITGELTGKQNVAVHFFGCQEEFATGAPALAHKMKSALLTCQTIRMSPLRYKLVIEPPIALDASLDRHQFTQRAVEEFAARVQRQVTANPASWDRWDDSDIQNRRRPGTTATSVAPAKTSVSAS